MKERETMTETLYIVDVATYGNIIKLFLSKTKNKDIWGVHQQLLLENLVMSGIFCILKK